MTGDGVAVLYGSAARGDADQFSDVDVLCVSDADAVVPARFLPDGASLSRYDWSEWEILALTGSIFLHHLKSESRVLWAAGNGRERYFASFKSLPEYQHVSRDFDAFAESIDSIEVGLADPDQTIEFELSALAMVVRHLSILICYLTGEVNFSRLQSLHLATNATGVASRLERDFKYLYDFRLFALGRIETSPSIPSPERVNVWIEESRQLVEAGRRLSV